MGALKRPPVDHHHLPPRSSSPSFSAVAHVEDGDSTFRPLKKSKLSTDTVDVGNSSPLPIRQPRRLLHAPQRILNVFGLGRCVGSVDFTKRPSFLMPEHMRTNSVAVLHRSGEDQSLGALESEPVKLTTFTPRTLSLATSNASSGHHSTNQKHLFEAENADRDPFGLVSYKKLVESASIQQLQNHKILETPQPWRTSLFSSDHLMINRSESRGTAYKDEYYGIQHDGLNSVRNRIVELKMKDAKASEERTMVELSSAKQPIYKELYESAHRSDQKLRDLDFELELAERKLIELHKTNDVCKSVKPKEEILEPFIPLTEDEERCVDDALKRSNSQQIFVAHKSSGIVITREILQCLSDGSWLNDEVINLYLELLKEREKREPKKFLKCHFFNTFFYSKLACGGNGYDFKAVKRWTMRRKIGYALLDCDKIFVPIHKSVHWCLVVINVREKKLQYLDSLGSEDRMVLMQMTRYLTDEVKDKCGEDIDSYSWKLERVCDIPLQQNGWDCGMFMLKYIDFHSRDMTLSFSQKYMPYFRRRTIKEILNLRAD